MKSLLRLLFPPRCAACRTFLDGTSEFLCRRCLSDIPEIRPPCCSRCSYPLQSNDSNHLCGDCLASPKNCRRIDAIALYQGALHDLIVRMKYKPDERLAHHLGHWIKDRFLEKGAGSIDAPWDVLVPIPLHRDRLRERGFNQALLLSRPLGRMLGKKVDPFLLRKVRATPSQARLTGEERRKNMKGSFRVLEGVSVKDKICLLVDDVYTTGTTIEEAAKTLLKAGAKDVTALVLARAH